MDVTVVVAYTGEPWRTWAHGRAIPSVERLGVPFVVGEGDTVAACRNAGLDQVTTEFAIILDADDELTPGYIDAMATGTADVRGPSVSYTRNGRHRTPPKMPKVWGHTQHDECTGECLLWGNWLIIGSAVRAEIAQAVRFDPRWPVYEDFDFWLRCYLAGATFEAIPQAVYVAHSTREGRNASLPINERNEIHMQICAAAQGLEVPT